MTLSLQEISDRFEIQDLVFKYSAIVDQKRFDDLREVFTEDAHVDYSAFGAPVGGREEIIAFLQKVMIMFPNHQHLNTNVQIEVEGDTATGRVMCLNPQEMNMPDDKTHIFMCGLWYLDDYVRTEAGWRIRRRVQEKSYVFNAPFE
ncbi:MAG: nuclear transport factor 2 family protein [Myxococcota bacterium]